MWEWGCGCVCESGDVCVIEWCVGVGIDGFGGEGERERRVRRDGCVLR